MKITREALRAQLDKQFDVLAELGWLGFEDEQATKVSRLPDHMRKVFTDTLFEALTAALAAEPTYEAEAQVARLTAERDGAVAAAVAGTTT